MTTETDTQFWPTFEVPKSITEAHKDGRNKFKAKYPFKELELGRCFLVPDNGDSAKALQNMQSLCGYHSKKLERVFKCWPDVANKTANIVVWRES